MWRGRVELNQTGKLSLGGYFGGLGGERITGKRNIECVLVCVGGGGEGESAWERQVCACVR